MKNNVTPEALGISSEYLLNMLRRIDRKGIPMHSLLIARGDDVLFDAYWAPFTKDTLHRMNSVTKSFVALAVGKLIEEGKLSLSDKVIDFFPEAKDYAVPELRRGETVEDLLTMRTSYVLRPGKHWVKFKLYDRIKTYFENPTDKLPGTTFYYDSLGSYILTVIVERLTGKPFLEYLKEKVLLKIGFSEDATCITDAMGYSWGDSGLLCTPHDLYRVGKFINRGGVFSGEQLMDRAYLERAVSKIVSNVSGGNDRQNSSYGYGYQIWHELLGGFGFHGMGMQYMICIPKLDLYLVCTADTQGYDEARALFIGMYEELVREGVSDAPLPENPSAYAELTEYVKNLKLVSLSGDATSPIADKISGKKYILEENKMGIKHFTIKLACGEGELIYENAQGEKRLPFGINKNLFSRFPQDGYDNLKIGESPEGYRHPAATSASWQDGTTFDICCRIIGNHLGGLNIRIAFLGNKATLEMTKTTNCFLNEYEGYAIGELEK